MKSHNNNNESLNGMHHSPAILLGLRRLLHSTITFPLTLSLNDTLKLTLTLILPLTLGLGLSSIFLTSCSDDSSNGNLDAVIDGGQTDGASDATDASPTTDNDDDGFPETEDCDDTNPDIYPSVRIHCENLCNWGHKTCMPDGTWTPCSAEANCECDPPGSLREVECGNCGWAFQQCGSDGRWEYPDECMDESTCYPGLKEYQECGNCGKRSRLCDPECSWRPWTACENESGCTPGDTIQSGEECTELGEGRSYVCISECEWRIRNDCTMDCVLTPRIGDEPGNYVTEICIPGGPFIMGRNEGGNIDERPAHTVYLTPYFIDKYEVTNGRYEECVNAGVCNEPHQSGYMKGYGDPDYIDHPVLGVTRNDAMVFCEWDGGRTLPTEAQWEKAARGPSPNEYLYPWGPTPQPACDRVNCNHCGTFEPAVVNSYEEGASYYGLLHMLGNAEEFVSDVFNEDYYLVSPELDPEGPDYGLAQSARGLGYDMPCDEMRITLRLGNWDRGGIRCARKAY